jgi:hypothetical protein
VTAIIESRAFGPTPTSDFGPTSREIVPLKMIEVVNCGAWPIQRFGCSADYATWPKNRMFKVCHDSADTLAK